MPLYPQKQLVFPLLALKFYRLKLVCLTYSLEMNMDSFIQQEKFLSTC